jgi:hypothetical protein
MNISAKCFTSKMPYKDQSKISKISLLKKILSLNFGFILKNAKKYFPAISIEDSSLLIPLKWKMMSKDLEKILLLLKESTVNLTLIKVLMKKSKNGLLSYLY